MAHNSSYFQEVGAVDNLAFRDPANPSPSPWQKILAILETRVSGTTFDTWFKPTKFLSLTDSSLRVSVPNAVFQEWIRSQFLDLIREAMAAAGLPVCEIEFVAPEEKQERRSAAIVSAETHDSRERVERQQLNPRYTFENFVVSSCNEFAHAAAMAVTDQPGGTYNPLFLYGGTGLGKTHLMQAIGHRLIRLRPNISLRYITSEEFMNELILTIRNENTPAFRRRYRKVEVLLVDDIQFLAGKESTQEEFFHTFNALHDTGHQIVLASDCPPRSIPALEERLRSRFEWGLTADIQPPDLETKVAILNKMAANRGWPLSQDVALYIAGNVHHNIRELEGCLTTLVAASSVNRRAPDLDLAREVLQTMLPAEQAPVTLDTVQRIVAKHFNLKVNDLRSRSNVRRISFPRQVAMYLAKKLTHDSLPTIGKAFGGKHHTTVLHAVRKITHQKDDDVSLQTLLAQLEEEMS